MTTDKLCAEQPSVSFKKEQCDPVHYGRFRIAQVLEEELLKVHMLNKHNLSYATGFTQVIADQMSQEYDEKNRPKPQEPPKQD